MLFFFGLACGVLLMWLLIWAVGDDPPEQPAPAPPRPSIHEIERQAVREMVATAMVNGQFGGNQPLTGNEVVPQETDEP